MKYLLLLLAPLVVLAAEPKAKKYTLNDLDWGKVVYGPALTEMTTKDKGMIVCVFVYSPENHPELLLKALKTAVDGTEGKVIGLVVEWNSALKYKDAAELVKLAKTSGIEYNIALGLRKRPPNTVNTVPYCFIMNAKKAIIYSGNLGGPDFDDAMKEAAASVEKPVEKAKDTKKDDKSKADPKKAA
jgi:hypothetical protein